MRKTLTLLALILGLLALAACSAAGLPAPQQPATPAPEAEAPVEPAAVQLPAEYVGVYTASLPAADSPGRDISVALEADGIVTVTSDYLNNEPPIVETGTWSANPSGTVTVVLTRQGDQFYFEPRSYVVGIEEGELLVMGEAGQVVRFAPSTGEPAAEPAAAAPSSEEAPAVITTGPVTTTIEITAGASLTTTMVTITETMTVTASVSANEVMTEEITLANTYITLRPAASAGGTQLLALSLFDDGAAQLATEFSREEAPIVDLGTWVDNGDDTLTVTLTGRPDQEFAEPIVVTFQREDDFLQSIDAQDQFGSEGLRLRLAADVAGDVSASLVTMDLAAGFPLDPTFVSVQGGGEVDASLLASHCVGFINQQPVVTVNWTGEAPFVEVFFISDSDPTLVVLTPGGQLLCNDDANDDLLDPVISLDDPAPGTYRIWVGSYAKNQLIPGILVLTTKPEINIGAFNLAGLIQRPLVPEAPEEPTPIGAIEAATTAIQDLEAEAVELVVEAEPINASLTVSGTIPLFELGLPNPVCNGLVNGVPDFVLDYTGDSEQFTVFFEGDGDATLLVLSEDGELLACGDDAEDGVNVNPLVTVTGAKPGLYGVWVGRLDPSRPVIGTLTITTAADAAPRTLAPIQ